MASESSQTDQPGQGQSPPSKSRSKGNVSTDRPDGRVIAEDWEHRLICSDPDCFGFVGPDKRCRECGKPVGEGL